MAYSARRALKNVVISSKVDFWDLTGSRVIAKNVKQLLKKIPKIRQKNSAKIDGHQIFKMEGLSQSELRTSIKVEYKMNKKKGKLHIIRHFWPFIRNKMITERTIYRLLDKLECISEFDFDVIINMFDSLKDKIHQANQSGLTSLN